MFLSLDAWLQSDSLSLPEMTLFFLNLSFSVLNVTSVCFKSYSVLYCCCFSCSFTVFPFLDGKKSLNTNTEAEHASVLLLLDKTLALLL